MINKNGRKSYQQSDKENEFSKSVHSWLAQYDEEDDFLCGTKNDSTETDHYTSV